MNRRREKIFLTATMVLCVLLFAVRLTGPLLHVVLGILLTVIMCIHIRKQFVKMKYQKPAIRLVDQVLFAALAIMFISGMLMHPLQEVVLVKLLHKLSAVLFILCMIGHAAQHRARRCRAGGKNVS